MTFDALEQQSTNRHAALYFSIVRRSDCCATLESLSTSLSTTILKPFLPVAASIGLLLAISLRISCTT